MEIKSRLHRMLGTPQPQPERSDAPKTGYRVMDAVYPMDYRHGQSPISVADETIGHLLAESAVLPGPGRHIYLDTETTGLSTGAGVLAFLIGLGWFEPDGLHVQQLFLREPAGEDAMITELLSLLDGAGLIVSFNGRSFDVPLLRSRLALNRRRDKLDIPHLDLLFPARRMWKLRLSRCHLTHLEEKILGFTRQDDIDGADIPAMYFAYLRDGNEEALSQVFEHNRLDIVALAALAGRMGADLSHPEAVPDQMDIFSIGRMHQRCGNAATAEQCYRKTEVYSRQAYAALLKKQGRVQEAIQRWETMADNGQGGIKPLVELAIAYEHSLRDEDTALNWTRRALEICAEVDRDALIKRETRLIRKLQMGRKRSWG